MLEININVKCPDLLLAVSDFAKLLNGGQAPAPNPGTPNKVEHPTTAPDAARTATAGNVPASAAPTSATAAPTSVENRAAVSAVQTVPGDTPTSAPTKVPTTAPSYTKEQVSKAGADMLSQTPASMPKLTGLLGQFGVRSINDLPADQLGAFATALRGLGANI